MISSTGSSETMPKATAPLEVENAQQIEHARPDDGDLRLQRAGVDDGRDGVGGVVEAVDEFKAERDQHRHAEQQERQDRGRAAPAAATSRVDRIGHEEQAAGDDARGKEGAARM